MNTATPIRIDCRRRADKTAGVKSMALLLAALMTVSCSGTRSTLREGFAYRMTADQAHTVVDSTLRAHLASDRMLPGSLLVATGYDRSIIDTQTYTLSALPVTRVNGYALEVRHRGTMASGPFKATAIYEDAKRRAALVGERVPVK